MKQVKIVKFASGEEIICEFLGTDGVNEIGKKCMQVKNPFAVAPSHDGSGIILFPWSISAFIPTELTYNIVSDYVLMIQDAPQSLENQYIEKTSGLTVPTSSEKSLILG